MPQEALQGVDSSTSFSYLIVYRKPVEVTKTEGAPTHGSVPACSRVLVPAVLEDTGTMQLAMRVSILIVGGPSMK
jgi:hypothetical protein